MKTTINNLLLVLLLLFPAACASTQSVVPSLIDGSAAGHIDADATLLPVLDSRNYPDPEAYPDVYAGIPVVIPAEEILGQAYKMIGDAGIFRDLIPYEGPQPERDAFNWSAFPLRGIDTDLAVGIELKKLDLRKTGQNALIVPHVLLDATALPVFSAVVLATNGQTDIGHRFVPSAEVLFDSNVELNIISLKGGGRIFHKTYRVGLTDPSVSEWGLHQGLLRSPKDGQRLGRRVAPRIIGDAFLQMARDPELAWLPRYARTAWIGRALTDSRVPGGEKAALFRELAGSITAPGFTSRELASLSSSSTLPDKIYTVINVDTDVAYSDAGGDYLQSYAVDPGWLEESRALSRFFDLSFQIIVQYLATLEQGRFACPADATAAEQRENVMELLAVLGRNYPVNRIYRSALLDRTTPLAAKKALFLTLARDLESWDNEEFVQEQVRSLVEQLSLEDHAKAADAAALLVALKGEEVLNEYPIPRDVLWQVAGPEDVWAAPLAAKALAGGAYSPELLRLAGVYRLEETVPGLVALLRGLAWGGLSPKAEEPEIPLLPAGPREDKKTPDAVLIARTLGCFGGNSEVLAVMRDLLGSAGPDRLIPPDVAAEAVLSLARLHDQASVERIFGLWSAEAVENGSAPVRLACLSALEKMAGPEIRDRLLAAVTAMDPRAEVSQPILREAADFFGRVRLGSAVPLLAGLAGDAATPANLVQSSMRALGLIADTAAEERLTELAAAGLGERISLARQALEQLALEKAFWLEMQTRAASVDGRGRRG